MTQTTPLDMPLLCEIEIQVENMRRGTIRILACHASEHFAVHPTIMDSDEWTVTHIATGVAVAHSITLEHAAELIEEAEKAPFDWDTVTVYNSKEIAGPFMRPIKARLREKYESISEE